MAAIWLKSPSFRTQYAYSHFFLGISSAGIAHVNRFDRRFHTASVGCPLRLPGKPLRRLAITRQSPAAHGRRKTDGRPTG